MTKLLNKAGAQPAEKLSLGLLVVVVLWSLGVALTGSTDFLLYVSPALLIALPLALGRYVGEEAIARLKGLAPRRPRATAAIRPHGHLTQPGFRPGNRLIAAFLAGRAPPTRHPAMT